MIRLERVLFDLNNPPAFALRAQLPKRDCSSCSAVAVAIMGRNIIERMPTNDVLDYPARLP